MHSRPGMLLQTLMAATTTPAVVNTATTDNEDDYRLQYGQAGA
jgi:hypothetical protein